MNYLKEPEVIEGLNVEHPKEPVVLETLNGNHLKEPEALEGLIVEYLKECETSWRTVSGPLEASVGTECPGTVWRDCPSGDKIPVALSSEEMF